MCCLVVLDLLEAGADPGFVSSGGEGLLVKLVEAVVVEGVLEVLEGESVLEDLGICNDSESSRVTKRREIMLPVIFAAR